MELFLLSTLYVLALQGFVFGLPVENDLGSKSPKSLNATEPLVTQNATSSNTTEVPVTNHTFIKFDNLRNQEVVPNELELKLQGYSSMRMLSPSEIDHPGFDPNHFLRVAGIETNQHIEVLPVSGKPYFMFIPPEMLKDGKYKDGIFSNNPPHRVKRHHPNVVQNVFGELQNFALVPIKSNNGQIRYILLKNPKFVIGKPQQNGQIAPTIVQLGSNRATPSTGGQQIRYTPQAVLPVTQPPLRYQPAITVQRHPRPIPHASSIDGIFSSPTKPSPLISISPPYKTETMTPRHFSAPSIQVEPLRAHNHNHKHSFSGVTPTKGDTTVQKTEVVETVVETQKAEASVAKADTAATAAGASQTVAVSNGPAGGTGVVNVETAAAASQSAAASSSSAAKQEKTVKKTKTTTTVIKGSDPTAPSGVGGVQQVQVVEETVHQGATSSVAAASESAAVSSAASSGTSVASGSPAAGKGVAGTAEMSASSAAASSASAAESNSTTTVKKKTIKKTTTITKSTDTSGLAGMNTELPTAVLSDLSTKSKLVATKNPPTAILSDTNNKKSTINTQAVLIATDKPKLVAPMMIASTTTVPTTVEPTTTQDATTIEEVEVEAEEITTAEATTPIMNTTAAEPTYLPTFPTTTDLYPPTTYPTSASYQFATNPSNQRFQQQNQLQPRRQQQQQQFQQQQQQFPQQQQQQFQQQQRPNQRRNMANRPPRRQQRRRQQGRNRPPPRKIVGSEVDHILSLFG